MAAEERHIVVGGGLAGLMCTIKLAEAGKKVGLFSLVPVKRSHSVCAQGGINAAVNTKGEGDSPDIHFYDTVKGGDFLAHQPLCKGMAHAAPGIVHMMDRMGVAFNRTPEGNLDFRRFGGTLYNRTAFAGATTGQQLIYALDEQVRRHEAEGLVEKFEHWEFLGAVLDDDGRCRGIVALDLRSMKVVTFRAETVCLATGGPGLVYGRTTNSATNNGSAVMSIYHQGAKYANGEFIQIHPTAIPGEDKLRLMSESARGEGGRVWVPKKKGDDRDPLQIPENERWYFLEERYPRFGNLVPRDVASREIYDVCINDGLGIGGKAMVYLDLTHRSREFLDRKLGGIMDIYEKFAGEDPREHPMKIFPAVHYSMGGIWIDYARTADGFIDKDAPNNHMTSIPGLYAAGECEYQYHGANRLGANSLLSCIYGGAISGPSQAIYGDNQTKSAGDVAESVYESAAKEWQDRLDTMRKMDGPENPYQIHQDLGELMIANVLIVRDNTRLRETLDKIGELDQRWEKTGCPDVGGWMNQSVPFVNHLKSMLTMAKIITKGALQRDECRGSHYKPEFEIKQPSDFKPEMFVSWEEDGCPDAVTGEYSQEHLDYMKAFKAQNEKWLKTTIATHTPDGPELSYEEVDKSLIPVRPRKYD